MQETGKFPPGKLTDGYRMDIKKTDSLLIIEDEILLGIELQRWLSRKAVGLFSRNPIYQIELYGYVIEFNKVKNLAQELLFKV